MRVIQKYVITEGETYLPKGADILHIAPQSNNLCVWICVDPDVKESTLRLIAHVTGDTLTADINDYYGTYLMYDGRVVLHIFLPK